MPRNRGQNLSVIGALGLRGMLATMSVEGAIDTEVFDVFIRRVLGPTLRPGDIVRLDNLSVPHASCIEHAVQATQGQVIFLPSYSPDFSPVEQGWAKLKTLLRGVAARTRRRVESAWRTALRTIHPEDIRGWSTHCGYLVPSKCKPL